MDNINCSNVNFTSSAHVYFYTKEGKRIVSDQNVRKCERYLVRQLNNAKNLKEKNYDLADTFKRGDVDYQYYPVVRSVYERTKTGVKNFVNIVTGKDVKRVDYYAKEIGKMKRLSRERIGINKSFETSYATDRYFTNAIRIADESGIYKNGKRQAFGVVFEPQYKKNGELKDFKYVRSAWFDENKVN